MYTLRSLVRAGRDFLEFIDFSKISLSDHSGLESNIREFWSYLNQYFSEYLGFPALLQFSFILCFHELLVFESLSIWIFFEYFNRWKNVVETFLFARKMAFSMFDLHYLDVYSPQENWKRFVSTRKLKTFCQVYFYNENNTLSTFYHIMIKWFLKVSCCFSSANSNKQGVEALIGEMLGVPWTDVVAIPIFENT